MKKALFIVIMIVVALTVVACDAQTKAPSGSSDTNTSTTVDQETALDLFLDSMKSGPAFVTCTVNHYVGSTLEDTVSLKYCRVGAEEYFSFNKAATSEDPAFSIDQYLNASGIMYIYSASRDAWGKTDDPIAGRQDTNAERYNYIKALCEGFSGQKIKGTYQMKGKSYDSYTLPNLEVDQGEPTSARFLMEGNDVKYVLAPTTDPTEKIVVEDILYAPDRAVATLSGIEKKIDSSIRLSIRVVTDSMAPTYRQGDIVSCYSVSASSLHVGDVIMYYFTPSYAGENRKYVGMHRITQVINADGAITYIVKGDANAEENEDRVSPSDVIGIVR